MHDELFAENHKEEEVDETSADDSLVLAVEELWDIQNHRDERTFGFDLVGTSADGLFRRVSVGGTKRKSISERNEMSNSEAGTNRQKSRTAPPDRRQSL